MVADGDRRFIGFVPNGEGLTCLEFVRAFSMALRPESDPEEARNFILWLSENLEGLDAIYSPEPDPRPTYPSLVQLRAA